MFLYVSEITGYYSRNLTNVWRISSQSVIFIHSEFHTPRDILYTDASTNHTLFKFNTYVLTSIFYAKLQMGYFGFVDRNNIFHKLMLSPKLYLKETITIVYY